MKTAAWLVAWLLLVASAEKGFAQGTGSTNGGGSAAKVRTVVSVELVTGNSAGVVEAQRWGELLSRMGVTVQSKTASEAKPELRERKQGTLRTVQVTAVMSGGNLIVPGRKFTLDREQPLRDWLRELETYGAQGKPDGKPGFGLSAEQFGKLFTELEGTVAAKTSGADFESAINALGLAKSMRPRFMAESSERLKSLPQPWKMPGELQGMSRGTALAIVLANAGLAFRPGRTPSGEVELIAVPLDEAGVWPIGWPLEKGPLQSLPAMVEILPIEFEDASLASVIELAAKQTSSRILLDHYRIQAKGHDLRKLTATQTPTRTMWSLLLQRVTAPHQMMRELLIDEAGNPFVWITTVDPKRLNDRDKQRQTLIEKNDRAKAK